MFGVETVREAGWAVIRGRAVRVLLFALAVWAGLSFATVARAQISSVRQAKLVTTDANGNPLLNDIAVATSPSGVSSRSFDSSAFASAIVTVRPVSGSCGTDMSIYSIQEIPGIYGWIQLQYIWTAGSSTLQISIRSATTQAGTFFSVFQPMANVYYRSVSSSCVFDASLVLVPFSSSIVSNGPVLANGTAAILSLAPNIIAGADDLDGDGRATVRAAVVNSDYRLLVTGTITPPVLATEDPIVPNSVTTSETVYSFDGTKRVTLSNTGTGALLCTVTTNSSLTVTTSNYTISLAAASIADNGTGSTITLPYVPASGTYLRCIALSGTAIAVGFAHP